MAIKIIRGTYGYRAKNGQIEPKTKKDAAFSLTEEQEARLVKKGIAVYVGREEGKTEEVAPEQHQDESSDVSGAPVPGDLGEEQLEEMSYNDLKHLAKEMGLSASGTKEELMERIAEAEASCSDEDGEEPPAFSAAEPE